MPESVSVDTSLADRSSHANTLPGEAPGQTFLATDTLIRSITVWRYRLPNPNSSPMKLWITEVESTGRPLLDHVVLEGPTIQVPFGDGIHPTKVEFAFDPPIVLPHRGTYFFAVQNACLGWWGLLANLHDVYPNGTLWRTERIVGGPCILRRSINEFADYDLIFTIVFCREGETPTLPRSWGQVKVIYR